MQNSDKKQALYQKPIQLSDRSKKLIGIILGIIIFFNNAKNIFFWLFAISASISYIAGKKLKRKAKWLLVIPLVLITSVLLLVWGVGSLTSSEKNSESSAPIQSQVADAQHRKTTDVGKKISPTPTQPQSQFTTTSTREEEKKLVRVTRVIDGDTIEIEGEKRVRYIGIDTPESSTCYAIAATSKNRELVSGKLVKFQKDVSETDRYGRLLRYIWVDDVFVNDYLVRQGYAQATSYPPDIKFQQQLREAQQEAISNNKGLWTNCQSGQDSTQPTLTSQPQSQQTEGCTIKGNISYSTGEKIYHVSGCQSYEKTKINESKGERWFCSEQEAVAAGWRKAKNCP